MCPRGTTANALYYTVDSASFQSTCPRGARLIAGIDTSNIVDFNPRAHEGHDSKEYIRLIFVYNSTAQFGTLEQTIIQ